MAVTRLTPSLISLILIALLTATTSAKTVFHDFHVRYVSGAPDGVFKEKILTVNGMFPGPTIVVEVGDRIEVTVHNDIQDGQNVSIHWHGIYQKGTPFDDGATHVTQCPLKNGASQNYSFTVTQPGTYWYHSHVNSQYTEGLWGPLIVSNKQERYDYDAEIILSLSDWYHRTARENEYWYQATISHGNPPYPDSALINGLGRYSCEYAQMRSFLQNCSASEQRRFLYRVLPGKTYRIRVINTAANSAFRFSIDGHKLHAIEVDGVDVLTPVAVDEATIFQGQRYSFLVEMKENAGEYLVRASIMSEHLQLLVRENLTPYPEALMPNVTAILQYRRQLDDPNLPEVETVVHDYTETVPGPSTVNQMLLDESLLQPADGIEAPAYFDKQFALQANFSYDPEGLRRATFNGSFFSLPDYPLLMTVIENGTIPETVNYHIVEYGDVVELIINNPFYGPHPFHLHGHHFWVVGKGAPVDGDYDPERHQLHLNGVRRDTVVVEERSWGVIRFVANNPGAWLFHCHNDWHNLSGMAATFIVSPGVLRKYFQYPDEAVRVCQLQGIELPISERRTFDL